MHNLNNLVAGGELDTPDIDHKGGINYTSRQNVESIESYDPGHHFDFFPWPQDSHVMDIVSPPRRAVKLH